MSEMGLVSRVAPVQTAVRNCTRDEGKPFGFKVGRCTNLRETRLPFLP